MDILFGNRVCLCFNSNSMKNKTITREHLVMGSQHNSSDPWILSSHYYIITTGDSLAMCTFPCESVIIAKCAPDDTHHKQSFKCFGKCLCVLLLIHFVNSISLHLWMNDSEMNIKLLDGYDLSSEYWVSSWSGGLGSIALCQFIPQSF